MDRTEQYIKMCDCPEIQKIKKTLKEDDSVYEVYDNRKGSKRKRWALLLRQDQIQGRFKDGLSTYYWLQSFWEFVKKKVRRNPAYWSDLSMEQLWLHFYMYEKHSKVWSSKEEKWLGGE